MTWILLITLTALSPGYQNLVQEIPQPSQERCLLEKRKIEQSATPGGPYQQTVACVQK